LFLVSVKKDNAVCSVHNGKNANGIKHIISFRGEEAEWSLPFPLLGLKMGHPVFEAEKI
jgi:hypothetical protein